MKNMKKTLSLILAVIMLLSAVPMQSFALFDWLKPEAIDVDILDNIPVSNKYVQRIASQEGNNGNVQYDLINEYRVYLSNGRTLEINRNADGSDQLSGVKNSLVTMYVNSEECAKAIEDNKNTVEVNVIVELHNLDGTFRSYTFKKDKTIVKEIVTKLEICDGMPDKYDVLNPLPDFVGKQFNVEFYDGTKGLATLLDLDDYYILGYGKVNLWCERDYFDSSEFGWEGGSHFYTDLNISFIDYVATIDTKEDPWYLYGVDIVDYKLNGKGGLTEVTYDIIYFNFNTVRKTCVLEKPIKFEEYTIIDNSEGIDIAVNVRRQGDSSYYVACGAAYNYYGLYAATTPGDITEFCDCRCHKDGKLNNIIYGFLLMIWEIFGKNKICQCGLAHWQ